MNHISLFSGIGGADLAAAWAGINTIAHSEIDLYCCKVLAKNFPGTPNLGDICSITKESFYHVTGHTTTDIISGGFPCQPFSVAGKQRGKEDDRYLWPQMLRVIRELKPSWVIGENVAGFISMGLDDALSDLESAGYSCRAFVLPACSVGAPHQRYRVFIVANADSSRCLHGQHEIEPTNFGKQAFRKPERCSENVAHTNCSRCEELNDASLTDGEGFTAGSVNERNATHSQSVQCGGQQRRDRSARLAQPGWWATEPNVGRVAHGVPARVDRIRALGNAIVPQVIYPIFKAILEASKGAS